MVKENIIPIENKKPFEIVQEVNNEIPSYEEFMKTYENDANFNYADLSGGNIGEVKGHGPNPDGCERKVVDGKSSYVTYQTERTVTTGGGGTGGCTCTSLSRFCLNIKCYNWAGDGANRYACSTSEALEYAHNLEDNNWYAANVISNEVLCKCANLVREAVRHHDRENRVEGYVKVQGKFWGGYEWSRNY